MRAGSVSIENRAIKNFTIHREVTDCGRCLLKVSTLGDVVIEVIEACTPEEAEQQLRQLGYERIPLDVAFTIDDAHRWP